MEDDLPDTRYRKTVYGNSWSDVVTTDLADGADLQNLTVHCAKDQQSLVIRPYPLELTILTVTGRNLRTLSIDLSAATEPITVVLNHCGFREIPECLVHPLVHLSITHNPLWFHNTKMDFYLMSKNYPATYPHPRYPEMLLELGYDGGPNFFQDQFYVHNGRILRLDSLPPAIARSRRFQLLHYPKYVLQDSTLPLSPEREWTDDEIAFFAGAVVDAEDAAHLQRKTAEHAAAVARREADIAAAEERAHAQAVERRARTERDRLGRDTRRVVRPSNFLTDSQNVHGPVANRGAREASAFVVKFKPSAAATAWVLAEVPKLAPYLNEDKNIAAISMTVAEVARHVCAAAYADPEMRDDIRAVIKEELDRTQMCPHGRTLKLLATLGGFYPEIRIGQSPSDEFRDRFATLYNRLGDPPQPQTDAAYLRIVLAHATCFRYSVAAMAAMTKGNTSGGVFRMVLDAHAVPAELAKEHVFATAFEEIYALKAAYPEVEPAITDAYMASLLESIPFAWVPLADEPPQTIVQRAVAAHVFGA